MSGFLTKKNKNGNQPIPHNIYDLETVAYEDVVKELAADTLYTNATIGIYGGRFAPGRFTSLVMISFKVGSVIFYLEFL